MFVRITFLFLFCVVIQSLQAQSEVIITNDDLVGGEDYTWESDKVYILDGIVVVKAGSKLTIEAGTAVKALVTPVLGTGSSVSALVVAQGAQIFALGEANNPIIFTSTLDDLSLPNDLSYEQRGLWGGLLICGNAPIGIDEDPFDLRYLPEGFPDVAGGDNAADNSGVLQYVSIRHAGASPVIDEELNCLTLAGVGNGTQIDHVEVFAGMDDGIALIGGTVNLKYVNSSFNGDDAYDIDLGWRGKGQFWFGILDQESSASGLEADGASPDDYFLYSQPELYNLTLIGQGSNAEESFRSVLFRDGCAGTLANSIITEFPDKGIEVEDRDPARGVDSRQRLEEGDLQILNNLWWAIGDKTEISAGPTGIINTRDSYEDPTAQFLIDHLTDNQNAVANPELFNVDWTDDNLLDPRPALGGPAYRDLATYPNDSFFTPVDFKGAFGQDAEWLFSWSALDDYAMVSQAFVSSVTSTKEVVSSPTTIALFPNPVSSQATLRTTTDFSEGNVALRLVDLMGRTIWTRKENLTAGSSINLPMDDLNPGNYILQLIGEQKIYVLPLVKAGN